MKNTSPIVLIHERGSHEPMDILCISSQAHAVISLLIPSELAESSFKDMKNPSLRRNLIIGKPKNWFPFFIWPSPDILPVFLIKTRHCEAQKFKYQGRVNIFCFMTQF